jgi:outer membrane protein assembly factor BamB
MGDRGDAGYVLAFDLARRKEVWALKVGEAWSDGGARCTPTVDRGLVYALGPHGDLVCAEAAGGKEVWRRNLPADFGGRMMSGWGYCESPLVDGAKLICTPGGQDAAIVALDRQTGAVIWKSSLPELGPAGKDGAAYASCVVAEAGGIRQYVTLAGRGLVGVAADDGRFLWGYNRVANGVANCSTPVVRGEYVFGSSAYGAGTALLKLTATNGSVTAREVYFLDAQVLQNHHGGMALVGDYLYSGHGQNSGLPVCIEFTTGRVVWRAAKAPAGGSAAVVYADGNLCFRYDTGEVVLLPATPDGYRQKGQFRAASVTGQAWAHPVILDGCLYLRDNDALLCYDIKRP